MKPIWYFVGLLLLSMGAIITLSGAYQTITPPSQPTVLAHLHPSLWWGAIMTVSGLIFLITNRKKTVE
jgi:hypothetical protein